MDNVILDIDGLNPKITTSPNQNRIITKCDVYISKIENDIVSKKFVILKKYIISRSKYNFAVLTQNMVFHI